MAQLADQLTIAVATQWSAEAAVRRLNDPYPLPVSWNAADPSLTDAWDSLVRLATSGAGWPAPPPPGTWAAEPDDLAGEGRELTEVLARVPTRRLVVLGEPGAGKTMLMVRLVLDLLARRAEGGPVPILVSVTSWNPAAQDLRGWLGTQLMIDHPALAGPPPTGREEPTQAAALIASGLILPILDGLDEIPEQVRGPAISRINDALRPGEQVVVTCRAEQYRDTVRPQDGVEVTLRAAAAVQLCPLDADVVRHYLRDDVAGPVMKARWDPVLAVLGTEAPAGQALATPLMVGLARAIYNPRPGERVGTLRHPAELCHPALADRAAVESLLFDAFIPAAYRNHPPGRWKAKDAERRLVFLARHLERTIGSADLAWWQLQDAAPRTASGLAAGLAVGPVAGLVAGVPAGLVAGLAVGLWAGLEVGLMAGLWAGLVVGVGFGSAKAPARGMRMSIRGLVVGLAVGPWAGLVVGLAEGHVAGLWAGLVVGLWAGLVVGVGFGSAKAPARGMRMSIRGLVVGLVVGPVVGLVVGFVGGLVGGFVGDLGFWLVAGLVAGPVAGLVAGLAFGLAGVPGDLAEVTSPGTVLARDRQVALRLMLVAGLLLVLAVGLVADFEVGPVFGLWAGLAVGPVAGFRLSMRQTAWPSYVLTRGWLAFRHYLPWSLMSFLSDAHQRGVLRQVGAVYQFRHIELQHRLANRDANEQQANSSTA